MKHHIRYVHMYGANFPADILQYVDSLDPVLMWRFLNSLQLSLHSLLLILHPSLDPSLNNRAHQTLNRQPSYPSLQKRFNSLLLILQPNLDPSLNNQPSYPILHPSLLLILHLPPQGIQTGMMVQSQPDKGGSLRRCKLRCKLCKAFKMVCKLGYSSRRW